MKSIEVLCAAAAGEASCAAAMARALAAFREHEHEVRKSIDLSMRKLMESNGAHPDTHLMIVPLADVAPQWRPYMPAFVRITPNAPQNGYVYFVLREFFEITGGPPL